MPDSLENPDKVKEENVFLQLKRINPTLYYLFERAVRTILKKNHDYAGTSGDFYKNFRKSEKLGIPAWKAIYLRMQDKMSRIETFIREGHFEVEDEPFVDTLMDDDNYFFLMMACYIDDGFDKPKPSFNKKGYHTDEDRMYESINRSR